MALSQAAQDQTPLNSYWHRVTSALTEAHVRYLVQHASHLMYCCSALETPQHGPQSRQSPLQAFWHVRRGTVNFSILDIALSSAIQNAAFQLHDLEP